MILLTRRDTAGCDDQVVLGAGHGKGVDQRRLTIRTNAKIADGTTKPSSRSAASIKRLAS